MSKMAVFGLKPRIFCTQGHNSVLWGRSEFTLDPMGWFYDVALQRAALKTQWIVWFGHSGITIALQKIMAPVCLQ